MTNEIIKARVKSIIFSDFTPQTHVGPLIKIYSKASTS